MKVVCKKDRFDFDFLIGLKLTLKKFDSYECDETKGYYHGVYYSIAHKNNKISMTQIEFNKYFYNDIEVRKIKLKRLNNETDK